MSVQQSKIDTVNGNKAYLQNPRGNRKIFLHKNDVEGKPNLQPGMLVEYELTGDGFKAINAKVIKQTIISNQQPHYNHHRNNPQNSKAWLSEKKITEKTNKDSESPYSIPLKKGMTVEVEQDKKFWQVEPEPRLSWVYQSRYLKQDKRYPPYHFVPVAKKQNVDEVDALLDTPVFHDGKNKDVYSGELQCSLTALTPLLVANDQYHVNEIPDNWKIKSLKNKNNEDIEIDADKSVLEPLRLPDGRVLISGASLKGMLRQTMTALLVAPMERVAERTYSYRLNTKIIDNNAKGKRYKCYPAIVEDVDNNGIPKEIKLLIQAKQNDVKYRIEDSKSTDKEFTYSYGLDNNGILLKAHEQDDPKKSTKPTSLKQRVWISPDLLISSVLLPVPPKIQAQYKATIEHLSDTSKGHLTNDHQLLRKISCTQDQLSQAIKDAGKMKKDQLIYVEVIENNENYHITSLGHNFRYRWRYADTVRTRWNLLEPQTRSLLQPVEQEKGESPQELSAARLLFGYVADDEGTADIGKDNFSRLAGRIALNMAVEVVAKQNNTKLSTSEKETKFKIKTKTPPRFLNKDKGYTVALKELGEPRPSAVEFYLQQDGKRPDRGSLITYGDVVDEDKGGELNGRKFYLHQPAAADLKNKSLYETDDDEVKASNQASLARFVSTPGTKFRFSLCFRDLRMWELGALLITLEPEYLLNNIQQLPNVENLHKYATYLKNQSLKKGQKPEQYPLLAHKLGHGRPLGLGSIHIAIDNKFIADCPENISEDVDIAEKAKIAFMDKLKKRINENPQLAIVLKNWLAVHQFRGQVQSAYPEHHDNNRDYNKREYHIYEFHTALRQRHARNRQFEKPNGTVRKETLILPELE